MALVTDGDYEWESSKAEMYPDRIVTLAMSLRARVLYVVTTERGERIRIISARRASPHEERIYEKE